MSGMTMNFNSVATAMLKGLKTVRVEADGGILRVRPTKRSTGKYTAVLRSVSYKASGAKFTLGQGVMQALGVEIAPGQALKLIPEKYGWLRLVPGSGDAVVRASRKA